MARSFRPVRVLWGKFSDCFLPSEVVVSALERLADLAGCQTASELRDGLYTEVWINKGRTFFDYLKKDSRSKLEVADNLNLSLLSDEDVAESEAAGDDLTDMATMDQFESFLHNLRSFADEWQANNLDPKDGSLRFYVD